MRNKLIILFIGLLLGAGIVVLYNSMYNHMDIHKHEDEIELSLYSCGMHPNIIEEEMGTCPICGMNLTPIKNSNKKPSTNTGDKKIIYWRAPMNPNEVYDAPGKSQMGMDLVPVYEDEGGASGVVTIDGAVLQSMNVKMEFVKLQTLSSSIYTNGVLETDERKEFALTTKFDGWIQKLYVNYTGQKVRKGQKLVDIYSPKLVAAQQELLTALNYDVTLSGSSKSKMVENAKRKLELFDISKKDIEKIISSKKIKKNVTLYAPYNGTILTKNVLEGEMIKAGKEIIKIADLSNLWLKADLYESELEKIDVGAKAEVTFSYKPDKKFYGKVAFIYPTVNPKTRTVTVRINMQNLNEDLKPSMFGNVLLKGKELKEAPTIPETAVLRSGKRNIVIRSLGEGKFKPVEVTLGLYSDGFYQVLTGLKENDAIVTSGQFMIDSESSLRSAVKLFTSDNAGKSPKQKMTEEEMQSMDKTDLKETDDMGTTRNESVEEEHNHATSIVHEGIIDLETIDKNGDGKVFQDPMDWNVISDEDGRCPVCGMFLKEVTIDEAEMNLKMNGFKYK